MMFAESIGMVLSLPPSRPPSLPSFLPQAFDWRLGPMGFLCETLWGGGASFGPLSWFFYVEGLLFPVSQTCHQKRIIEALLPSLPHHLPSAPIPFGRGHNQGLLILSKHPLHRPLRQYLTCTPVHHMGFQAFTVAPLPREGRGKGGEAGAREDIRFVNLHLVPNFHTHPWKGRVLGWLGERDVPRMQAKQLAEIGEEVGREGGKEGGTGGRAWCVVGDFNVHRPRVLGVGSLVDQVSDQKEQGGPRRRRGKNGEGALCRSIRDEVDIFLAPAPPPPRRPSL